MKDENYITIQGWMINDLNLNRNELIVYALIWGFCQDGKGMYNGSYDYIAKWINVTRRSAIDVVSKLIEKGLIIKKTHSQGNSYYALRRAGEESSQIGEVTSLGSEENSPVSSEESSPNNNKDKYIYINNNKYSKNFKIWTKDILYRVIADLNTEREKKINPVVLRDFYEYWIEPNPYGKLRFQLEKTWDTNRRLNTWVRIGNSNFKQTEKAGANSRAMK